MNNLFDPFLENLNSFGSKYILNALKHKSLSSERKEQYTFVKVKESSTT